MNGKIFCYIMLALCLSSCASKFENTISSQNVKEVFSAKKNFVVFWASWCGASQGVIKSKYRSLCADNDSVKVILICGNSDTAKANSFLRENAILCSNYFVEGATNYFPGFDRSNIKDFILSNFKNTDSIDLEGNFMVPVSILVNNNLEVLHSRVPQDSTKIVELNRIR